MKLYKLLAVKAKAEKRSVTAQVHLIIEAYFQAETEA